MNITEQAKAAFKSGQTLSDNPYPVGTKQHIEWRATWQRASLYFDWRDVPHPMDGFLRARLAA